MANSKPKESDDEDSKQQAAFVRAYVLFGSGVSVGRNYQKRDATYFVSKKVRGEVLLYGQGSSWDEAISNTKPVSKNTRKMGS